MNTHAPQPPTVCCHCDPGSSSPCRARRGQCSCSQILLAVKVTYGGLFSGFKPPLRALLAPSRAQAPERLASRELMKLPATPSTPAAASPAGLTPFESYYRKQRIVPDEEWPAFAARSSL